MSTPRFLGLDFGTSGLRACAIAPGGEIEAFERIDFGPLQDFELAGVWREALWDGIARLPQGVRRRLAAVAVDGTSATLLACDEALMPLHAPLLYNDARAQAEAEVIRRAAGPEHPAASATSGLAKALWLRQRLDQGRPHLFLNQADWLAGLLAGQVGFSDYHNALKLGFDVDTRRWPDWASGLVDSDTLPKVVAPGTPLGPIDRSRAYALGLPTDCLVRAGTTDSIAAFLAAGVTASGEAVTSLGTTLVLKLLSATKVESGQYGVYSHWFGERWLAGGASNAGGGVLRQCFDDAELATLSARIDPGRDSGLDYYPLPRPGERFPINDPALPPRLEPRPEEPAQFLHGLLEGLARIEALGYKRLQALGATPLRRVFSAGGGARNPVYTALRARILGTEVTQAAQQEAAYGSARLACLGTGIFMG